MHQGNLDPPQVGTFFGGKGGKKLLLIFSQLEVITTFEAHHLF